MKCFISFVCFLSVMAVVSSAPLLSGSASASLQIAGGNVPSSDGGTGGNGLSGLTNILSQIDLPGLLRGVNSFVKLVGVFCPPLSQVLDNVIQNVTSVAFRTFGRAILQNGGLGGGGGRSGGEQRVSVVLPTFPPDDYDDEDESESTTTVASRNAVGLSNEKDETSSTESTTTASNSESSDDSADSNAPFTSPLNEESNNIAKRHIRVTREAAEAEEEEEEEGDQELAESAPQPGEEAVSDDQDRNKRYLPFGGTVDAHAAGAGGGSGNFIFDLIRLVAGSGATEESDEKANAPGILEVDVQKTAADHEPIPGPITRLFVIANRGVANLVQDLILRLAQTSERLVNFKARLITSLI